MSRRLTFTDLLDLAEGRLAEDEARRLEAEAMLDEEAAGTLAWIREFLVQAQRLPLTQPPPELSAHLRALFAGAAPASGDGWTTASLLHDTRQHAAAGVRSARGDTRHLAFDSPAGRFIVEVRPAGPDLVDLSGMVLLDGSGGASLTFLEAGVVRGVARCRRDGHFEATAIPRGVDELQLTGGDIRLRAALDLLVD